MKASVAARIRFEVIRYIPILIIKSVRLLEIPIRHRKIIIVHKGIIPSIIRRIDIDHRHLAEVRLLQQLQHIEIVPLDVEVLTVERARCAVPPHAVRYDGTQRHRDRRIRRENRLPLVRPCECIALLAPLHDLTRELLPQHIKVNRRHSLPIPHDLRQRMREQPPHLLHIPRHIVHAMHLHPLHRAISYSAHISVHIKIAFYLL